jgi:glycerophosphoryl diester phosphodiesterase
VAKSPVMRLLAAVVAVLLAVTLGPVAAVDRIPVGGAVPEPCLRVPDVARWLDAGEPDEGLAQPRITVHRGAMHLAPENTIAAYEYAIAYDMPMIEVDIHQTIDGRYVVFHDLEVDAKTDGSGYLPLMTAGEALALNVADNDRWRGSAYDPSRMPLLEEVLALAEEHEVGINFDLKESVINAAGVALLARRYEGVIERSIFQPYVPGRTEQILAVAPNAAVMMNNQLDEHAPPALFYALGLQYRWFGSSLRGFSPESIAAIHDACSFVQPNVYQGHVTGSEAGDLAHALAIGADGAMVNRPEVAAEVLGRPVATTITVEGGAACLLGHRGLGLPGKVLDVDGTALTTGRGGCVDLPADAASVRFAGDGSAQPSAVPLSPGA